MAWDWFFTLKGDFRARSTNRPLISHYNSLNFNFVLRRLMKIELHIYVLKGIHFFSIQRKKESSRRRRISMRRRICTSDKSSIFPFFFGGGGTNTCEWAKLARIRTFLYFHNLKMPFLKLEIRWFCSIFVMYYWEKNGSKTCLNFIGWGWQLPPAPTPLILCTSVFIIYSSILYLLILFIFHARRH